MGTPVKLLRLALLYAALAGAASAGRPLATDDARILEPGRCHVETWVARERGGGARESWLLPACNLGGGAAAAEWALGVLRSSDGGARTRGWQAQLKTVLVEADAGRPGLALAFGTQRAAGSAQPYAYLAGTWEPQAAWALHANLGAVHEGAVRATRANWAAAAEWSPSAAQSLAFELFGQAGAGARWQASARRELLPGRLHLDASVARPVSGRGGSGTSVSVGMKVYGFGL